MNKKINSTDLSINTRYNLRSKFRTRLDIIKISSDFSTLNESNIEEIFKKFNSRFFWGHLAGVKLEFSTRLKKSAGVCEYQPETKSCCIRLSSPLLSLRPHSDLVDTLLHEMIHAYLFLTNTRDSGSHGPEFRKHMDRINKESGTNITVYHNFHSEVKLYQQHWWRCNGPCQNWAPFFGMVKRSMNRAPGPSDSWWHSHYIKCGGQYTKIREPENQRSRKRREKRLSFGKEGAEVGIILNDNLFSNCQVPLQKDRLENTTGYADMLKSSFVVDCIPPVRIAKKDRSHSPEIIDLSDSPDLKRIRKNKDDFCSCPLCDKQLSRGSLNGHLEMCEDLQLLFSESQFFIDDDYESVNIHSNKNNTQPCPICGLNITYDLTVHITECLHDSGIINIMNELISPLSNDISNKKNYSEILTERPSNYSPNCCPVCDMEVKSDIKSHLEGGCLNSSGIFDDLDNPFDVKDYGEFSALAQISLPVSKNSYTTDNNNTMCNKQINACPICTVHIVDDLKIHVDECLSNSGLFDDSD